jgi:hypothetical protein
MFVGVCAGLQSAAAAAVAAAGSAAGVGNGFSSLANTLAAGYGNNSLGTIGSPALGSLGSGILRKQPHEVFCFCFIILRHRTRF